MGIEPIPLKVPRTALLKYEGAFIPGIVMPLAVHASIMLFIYSYLHHWNPTSLHLSCIFYLPSPLAYPRPQLTPPSLLFSIPKLTPPALPYSDLLISDTNSDYCTFLVLEAQLCSSPMPELASSFSLFHAICLSHPLSSKLLIPLCSSYNAWKVPPFSSSLSSCSIPPVLNFLLMVSRVPSVPTTSTWLSSYIRGCLSQESLLPGQLSCPPLCFCLQEVGTAFVL